MTPRLEGSRLILGPSNPRYFGNLLRGNKIANLAQDVPLRPCWVDRFVFHPCLVAGPKRQPNTFFSKPRGWLCIWFTNNAASETALDTFDGAGNVTQRVWKASNGTTNRTQTLSWDSRGRLYEISERDSNTNGYDWFPSYDP